MGIFGNVKLKSFFLSIGLLALILSFTTGISKAYAAQESAIMYGSEHSVKSYSISATKGSTMYFQWVVDEGSKHALGFGVYNSAGTLVSVVKNVSNVEGSNSFGYVDAPLSGSYYLKAVCGGTGQTGCRGSGYIKNF